MSFKVKKKSDICNQYLSTSSYVSDNDIKKLKKSVHMKVWDTIKHTFLSRPLCTSECQIGRKYPYDRKEILLKTTYIPLFEF